MKFKDIKVILGDREVEDSNMGYPLYGDITSVFNDKYGEVFDKVYALMGFVFEDEISEMGIDEIINNYEDTLIHEIEYSERVGSKLTFEDIYVKVKGMSVFMYISSLEPIIFSIKDNLKGLN